MTPRFYRLIEHLHSLGPRPLAEFLAEVEAGDDLHERLEVYSRLSPDVVAALGGDLLPTAIWRVA